jgi:WD40 repeat protein
MTSDPGDLKSRDAMRVALQRELASPETQYAPPTIPDHELLQRIGSGAYGDVWLARNALGTLRAVKIVYRARFDEDRPYEREFKGILKYEPISRTHEGLVQILHVGRNEEKGCFYYVMELADNAEAPNYSPRTLRSELRRRQRFSPVEAAQLALRLAGAVGHLHDQGLIHRDIKPGNVIFVNGQPKLADIGLITGVGDSRSFVGTEGFIPPEGPGSPQADLYGLGKVLYELATGRDRLEFPQLTRGVARMPEGEALLELNEVMTRACTPDSQQRYVSATELEADLNLFLAGRSLRRARNIERHLTQLKRFAAAACAFLVLAAVAVWFSNREERLAREKARQAEERARTEAALRQRVEAAEHQRQSQLYAALLEQARATVRSGELGQRVRALDAARRAAAISNTAELRREVVSALALPDLRFEREWSVGPDFTWARFDPKFERLALFRGRGPTEIRSVADDRLLATLPPGTNRMVYFALWSDDGRYLAVKRDHETSGQSGTLEVWEAATARLALLVREMRWSACSFHPRKAQLLTGGNNGLIVAWDLETGKELARTTFPVTPVYLVYSPDGDRIAASYPHGEGWRISVHSAADVALLTSQAFAHRISSLDWHPSGRWLGASDLRRAIHLVDSRTGESRTLGRHKGAAVLSVFHPNGRYLISAGWEREFVCWDLQNMQRAFTIGAETFHGHFSSDGKQFAMLTTSGVKLYAFEPPTPREFPEDLGPPLRSAVFSSDGRWLAVSADKRLGVWDLASTAPAALAEEAPEARPFFTANGKELFASGNGECFRWRIAPGTDSHTPPQLERLEFHKPAGFTSLCVISNEVAVTGSEGTQVVDPAGTRSPWKPTSGGISGASPDGQWLGIYRAFAAALYVYRLPGLERVAKLPHPASIGSVKFSPKGDEVAITSRGQVELWNTLDWKRTRVLTNFMRLQYTPDGQTLWLAKDYFGGAGLYDARTLEPLLPLPAGTLPLALSADGRHLAVSVDADRLQVWDLVKVREQLRELGLDWADGSSAIGKQ